MNNTDLSYINNILTQINTNLLSVSESDTNFVFSEEADYWIFLKDLLLNKRQTSNSVLKKFDAVAKEQNFFVEETVRKSDLFIISDA